MNKSKKHHIIPQCLLNQFVGSEKKLARLKFRDEKATANKLFHSSGVGYAPEFYTIPDAENPLIVETEKNQSYENDFKKFWRLLEEGENCNILIPTKKRICEIMIHFQIRSNHIRDEVFTGSVITEIEEKLRQSSSEQIGMPQSASALYKGLNEGSKALQDFRKLINDKGEKALHNKFLASDDFQSSMDGISELYLNSQWIIHMTDEDHPFILSDNLGLTLNENDQKWPMSGAFQFFFPISSIRYLEIAHLNLDPYDGHSQDIDFQTLSPEGVQQMNLLICSRATKEIYGIKGSVLEAIRKDYLSLQSRTGTE